MSDGLAPLVRHAIAPLWARWERSDYLRHQRLLRRTERLSPEEIAERQWRAAQAIVRHAAQTTAFYPRHWSSAGLAEGRLARREQFQELPLVGKDDLRQCGGELRSTRTPRGQLHVHKTSGSTGKALSVVVDDRAQQWRRATTLRSDQWTGWKLGQRAARVWGNPDYLHLGWRGRLRQALLDRALYLDTLRMDEAALRAFLRTAARLRPTLLMGHAHSLFLLARFAARSGEPLWRPRGIIATAMTLHDFERRAIEQAFGRRVTNRYGCEEVGLIACQCEQFAGLHVNADNVLVEIVDSDGRAVRPGEVGAVVVTDLTNHAMPLIRYRLGDRAVAGLGRCPCGRGLPLLARIEGREADYVVTPAGELISGISLTENFAALLGGVAELQIIQERSDLLRLRIVRGPDYSPATERQIDELSRQRFGAEVRVVREFVDRIEPEASGKYRFCVSRLADPLAAAAEAAPR